MNVAPVCEAKQSTIDRLAVELVSAAERLNDALVILDAVLSFHEPAPEPARGTVTDIGGIPTICHLLDGTISSLNNSISRACAMTDMLREVVGEIKIYSRQGERMIQEKR